MRIIPKFYNCEVSGSLSAMAWDAGIVGFAESDNNNLLIKSCENHGKIDGGMS